MNIPLLPEGANVKEEVEKADHIVDAIFGFSFKGAVREPFSEIIAELVKHQNKVTSVDAPSGWDIEAGPPSEGPAKGFMPAALVSLTAPKPLVRWYGKENGGGRHFVGGRFVSPGVRERFGLGDVGYEGVEQVREVPVGEIEIRDKKL